jgi:hypothetical protein
LKLTNTPVVATDDNQLFFRFADDVASGAWQVISSVAGTDTTTTTSVTVAVSTVYHLKIMIDSARVATFYINGTLVHTTGVLADAIDLIPYVGIQNNGAADAFAITVRGEAISRTYA